MKYGRGRSLVPSGSSRKYTLTIAVKKKKWKIGYYICEVLSNFLLFLYFVANIFGEDCLRKEIFHRNLAQSLSHFNFWKFSVISKHFSNHDKHVMQVSCVKSSKFNGFVWALFCIIGLGQKLTLEHLQLSRFVVFWRN